ncbi:hypothetical protein KUTeg_000131 [Tegillarca granosa]|uniref:Uncharacterized protein n=1 Tax=Tegillarca granosa TaxID=220873 RepID=A0ABQ9G120_TEGGR|nr:hypothetical protein KUTeg_000131 [Tegillarca granosa]
MAVVKSVIALIFSIVSVVFLVSAFASPYWVESFQKADNKFVKCGLWEFCFNDYTFWKDYNGKRYKGCWYIFSQQYRNIWEWLSPPWFISVQVMVSVCLLIDVVATFILILMVIGTFPEFLHSVVFFGISFAYFFQVFLAFIAMVVFGVFKEDRQWVPRPDQNYLSWSYGFFVISAIFALFSGLVLIKSGQDANRLSRKSYNGPPRY